MGKIITIANQKGGVGKTTTSVNLSSALAEMGYRVLVIDLDPQANATSGLGVDKNLVEASLYDVFNKTFKISSVVVSTSMNGVWLAPSSIDLTGIELELASEVGRENILKDQLDGIRDKFDYIFIDCPPSLSLLTVNAFVCCESVLVPLQAEYYALEGVSALIETIQMAQNELNPELELEGVVLTMFDPRTNLSKQVQEETKNFFGDILYDTVIPRSVRLSECPSYGQPIFVYDHNSAGARAYLRLAHEFVSKQEKSPLSVEGEGVSLKSL